MGEDLRVLSLLEHLLQENREHKSGPVNPGRIIPGREGEVSPALGWVVLFGGDDVTPHTSGVRGDETPVQAEDGKNPKVLPELFNPFSLKKGRFHLGNENPIGRKAVVSSLVKFRRKEGFSNTPRKRICGVHDDDVKGFIGPCNVLCRISDIDPETGIVPLAKLGEVLLAELDDLFVDVDKHNLFHGMF
jgi:hypothetical protein